MVALQPPVCDFGKPAIDFDLPGTDGQRHRLASCRGPNGLLVMFICNHCPYVQAIIQRLKRDCSDLNRQGIGCVAIMSNDVDAYPEDAPASMQRWATELAFPSLTFMTNLRQWQRATVQSARRTSSVTTPGSNCSTAVDWTPPADIQGQPMPSVNFTKRC